MYASRSVWPCVRKLATLAAFSVVFCLALFRIQNFDFWWHLRTGQLIVEAGKVPSTDPYCFTGAGRLWVNPSWLADVALWFGYRLGGWSLLGVGKALMIVATFWGVYRTALRRGADEWITLCLVVFAALAARPRFILRPFLVSGLFAVVLVYTLEMGRLRIAIPLMFVLWTNLHAGWPAGTIILAAATLDEMARARSTATFVRSPQGRPLVALMVLSVVAALLNPFGWQVFSYPFRLMTAGSFMRGVEEWRPPDFSGLFRVYWCVLLVSVVAALATLRRARLSDLLLIAFFGTLSVSAQRHIYLLCVLAPLVAGPQLSGLCRRVGWLSPERVKSVSLTALLAVLAVSLYAVINNPRYVFGTGIRPRHFPEKAAQFLARNDPPGEICNEYAWGGFLEWKLYPDRQMFIDGRCLVHGEKVYRQWQTLSAQQEGWRKIAAEYGVKTLVLMRGSPASLYTTGSWQVAYWDDLAVIWVLNCKATRAYRARHDSSLSCPDVIDLALADSRRIPAIEAQLRRKLKSAPDCIEAYRGLMKCALARKDPSRALEPLREVIKRSPKRPDLWNDLGYCYAKSGEFQKALVCYQRAARLGPRLFVVHLNMGDALVVLGDLKSALNSYLRAIRANPNYYVPYVRAGDVAADLGQTARAKMLWAKAKRLGAPPAAMKGRLP